LNPLLPESCQRHLILASRSPRRVDILRGLGFEFAVEPAEDHIEDGAKNPNVFERPEESARLKAQDVAARHDDAVVIGADTVVIIDDVLLEKPKDDDEARGFLRQLSGRTHTVVTGVAVVHVARRKVVSGCESTAVRFRELAADEIERYVASGEGRDKAGSYAVQGLGAGLVRTVNGCFYNVVGLPVSLLFDLLQKAHA